MKINQERFPSLFDDHLVTKMYSDLNLLGTEPT